MNQPIYGEKLYIPNMPKHGGKQIEATFCRGYGEYAYWEQGKAAYVYLLETQNSEAIAVKVFKPNFRTVDLSLIHI